jgi:hypothetical protein
MKTFFRQIWRIRYKKNLSFIDFKTVSLILVNSEPKNRVSQKNVLPMGKLAKSQENRLKFLWRPFYLVQMYIFEISIKRRILEKNAPKKGFSQITELPIENWVSLRKIGLLGKTFWGPFLLSSNVHF